MVMQSAFGVRCLGTAFKGGGKPPHSEGRTQKWNRVVAMIFRAIP